jgi:hypothetical protein
MDDNLFVKYSFIKEYDYDAVKGPDWPTFADFQKHTKVPKWVYDEIDTMLFGRKPFDHPSFCVLPWHGKEVYFDSSPKHCCLLPDNYDVDKIRAAMKQGTRPEECNKCWKLEDNNLPSDRYLKNSALDFYLGKNIADIMRDAAEEKTYMLKTVTSFTCNGACVYCDSTSSSYWNTIERRIDKTIPIRSYKFIGLEEIEKSVDLSQIKTLTLIGGEPFLEPRNFDILQRLLDLGNDQVFVSVVSNASIELSQAYQNMLSRFKNLNLCLSIDGRYGIFDYQRWPLKWSQVEKNLPTYFDLTKNISLSCSITNMSVFYYNDFKQWLQSQGIPWLPNPIYQPQVFSPANLPVDAKHRLKDMLDHDDYEAFIGDPNQSPVQNWPDFLKEISNQDRGKRINIRDFIPEFCDVVGI